MKRKKFFSMFILLILGVSLAGFKLIAKDSKSLPASKPIQVSKSSQPTQIKSGKNLTLYVATDIHYLAKSLTDNGTAFNEFMNSGDGKQLNYIDQILGAFVKEMKDKKPDFLIVSGDLTTNGEKQSHIDLANIFRSIEKSGVPVFVIPGNHDINNPNARGFRDSNQYLTDTINASEFSKIYEDFGYKEALSRDKSTLSYLAAPSKDVWLLMLDASQYDNNMALGFPQANGLLSDDTFQWIRKCSAMAKKQHARIITVMHQNLLDHVKGITKGYTLDNSKDAIKVFQECGLNITLSGHIHIQDIKADTSAKDPIYDIVTSAISVYPQHYGILKYSPKGGFDYSTSSVDVEGYAKELALTDPNLQNFKAYSKNFFGETSYKKFLNRYLQYDDFSSDEVKAMANTMMELNLRLFSGTANENLDEIINTKGYKLLEKSGLGSLSRYSPSVVNNTVINNNKLHIQ